MPSRGDPPRLTAALGPAAVPTPPEEPALIRAVSGSLAAMLSEAVTHPIDLVKVRLQLTRGATGPDMVRTVAALVRDEGASSLLLGVRPALYRQAVYQYVRMGAYEPIRDAVSARAAARKGGKAGRRKLLLRQQLVAGGLAGAMGTLVASPLDLVKVRQQAGADMHAHLCAAEALADTEGALIMPGRSTQACSMAVLARRCSTLCAPPASAHYGSAGPRLSSVPLS